RVLILPEAEWNPHSAPGDVGFGRLERVVYYQLSGLTGPPAPTRPLPPLEFAPLTAHNLATVLALDHAAFPWLWWNSEAELRAYSGYAGVQIWLGWTAGVPVAYAGFTTLDRWGHLDRLATAPGWHGRGYGAAMLAYALGRMAALGVARVTLSTQATNTDSQRLYQGFGFRPTREVYDLYGQWLDSAGPP
ncbi:MAG: GNAT family N-acetyltransferase, partial [Chloroflexota bacterium]|nr:GNAT family N-acetyltransferase [Chloroflexota bacterium]